jgi:hypothetical protein
MSHPHTADHAAARPAISRRIIASAVIAALVAVAITFLIAAPFDRTAGGEVAVVRNGGPFDNRQVRQIIEPASGLTYSGMFSESHKYPAQQRFYTITSDARRGDRAGVDVEQDPTADGVEIGVEGTVYFNLNLDSATLKAFDDKYGTRKYLGQDGQYRSAWDGEDGWNSFLDTIVRPVISNDLRQQVGDFQCAELQASCALVQAGALAASNANSSAAAAVFNGSTGKQNNVNIQKIQTSINSSLEDDLTSTLGGKFITNVRFNLAKITLPTKVQTAIEEAQAEFAGVSKSQARVAQARADALANEQRQKGYQQCPACAQIDTLKAIPPSVTTFAPGAGFAITAK